MTDEEMVARVTAVAAEKGIVLRDAADVENYLEQISGFELLRVAVGLTPDQPE